MSGPLNFVEKYHFVAKLLIVEYP